MSVRLWRRVRGFGVAAPVLLALGCGGCSLSYQFDSFLPKMDKAETTGSISAPAAKLDASLPPEHDLAFTKAAATDALSRNSKDVSMPWENPQSGARGTVTPIATAYTQDGATCRDFLASYVGTKGESWMRGEACRAARGKWEVRSLKPWTRS